VPPAAPGARAGGGRGGRGGGRAALTPEQQEAQRAAAAALATWRAAVPMDRIAAVRAMYNQAGVTLAAYRLTLTQTMTDAEYDYAFRAVKALGAGQLTMELPASLEVSQRIGTFAAKHQVRVGYHMHLMATMTAWDKAMAQSPMNGIQLDIGHYVAGTSESPIPFIQKHHARIASLHLKDRKRGNNTGVNMPWGQGDTPIAEVLQLMKKEGWTFPAFIELEYPVPAGSTKIAEVAKCVAYCKAALG
jgi:sugar phosphate isomerase/epimerase